MVHVGLDIQVTQLVGLVGGLPRRRTECRQSRGEGIDVTMAAHCVGRVLTERGPLHHHPGRSLGNADQLPRTARAAR
jgi:hypothetical protein